MLRVSALELVIATTIGLLLVACSALAGTIDSFTVYVGYADNLRASGFFPNPWIGMTFNGQPVVSHTNPSGMSFDSGAVRIDNTGATPLTIGNFMVKDNNGSVVFAIWGAGVELTLAPGQTGVFTQKAERLNRARDLLLHVDQLSVAVERLARGCSISPRQAYRYLIMGNK